MINIYFIRKLSDKILRKLVKPLIPLKITPDTLTLISFLFAIISATFFYYSGKNFSSFYIFLAALFLIISSFLDALDGPLAREMGKASKKGDFLDHTLDRFADVLLILGIVFGGYVNLSWGIITITIILLISYLGVQAQALGIKREYRGLMGRFSRLIILIFFAFLNSIYQQNIEIGSLSFSFLGWAIVIFVILGLITIIQRFFYIWKDSKTI